MKQGSSRNVILIGRYAIKFPRFYSWYGFLLGLCSNITESQFSSELMTPYLAKVKFSDPIGIILVMERADFILEEESLALKHFFREARKNGCPVDPRPCNVGSFKGKLKLIDYGN